MKKYLAGAAALVLVVLAGCATAIRPLESGAAVMGFQNLALNPRNGGQLVTSDDLQPGDIILTATNGLNSLGIRLATLSPVSHAAVYLGNHVVAEAIGKGVQLRTVGELVAEEATVVALRHPQLTAEQAARIKAFAARHEGGRYNYVGVILQAPFALERRVCELPLVPSLVRDFCIRGVASVQLGLGSNEQFFCSQFVLEAYRFAGLPLTDADPRLFNPGDLLHMREGDIPSVRIHQSLLYIGHLKAPPETVAANETTR